MYPKHEKLLSDLAEKTAANSINWESSEVSDQFILKLKNGAILFDKQATVASGWDQDVEIYYSIKILNNVGGAIDEFDVERGNWHDVARTMYETIRRRIHRIDEQLDEIIREIDSSDAN